MNLLKSFKFLPRPSVAFGEGGYNPLNSFRLLYRKLARALRPGLGAGQGLAFYNRKLWPFVSRLKARPSLQSRKAWPFVLLALLTLAYLLLRSPSIPSASWFNDAGVYPERSRGTFRQKFTFGNSEEALKIELNLITLSWVVSKVGYLALTYDSLALRSYWGAFS